MIVKNLTGNPVAFGNMPQIAPQKTGELKPPFNNGHAIVERWIAEGKLEVIDGNDPSEKDPNEEHAEIDPEKPITEYTRQELFTALRNLGESPSGGTGDERLRAMLTDAQKRQDESKND